MKKLDWNKSPSIYRLDGPDSPLTSPHQTCQRSLLFFTNYICPTLARATIAISFWYQTYATVENKELW